MPDPRIQKDFVQQAIQLDRTHTIWTPILALERMGIEKYPFQPKGNRMAMRRVLESLCECGVLEKRTRMHSHGVFREVAYELRPTEDPDKGPPA